MNYIINPWWFYLAGVLNALRGKDTNYVNLYTQKKMRSYQTAAGKCRELPFIYGAWT